MAIGLFGLFLVCLSIQVAVWLRIYRRPADITDVPLSNPKISVIIAAKNEAHQIKECIERVLDQDYPDFELIVVDDHSTDETLDVLHQMSAVDPRISVLSHDGKPGKKKALAKAIEAATGIWIATIDADCVPISKYWLISMIRSHQHADTIVGYGPYAAERGLLNKLIRYEAWLICRQYMGMLRLNKTYMGVGRNLLYKKEAYHRVGGYATHEHLLSGDDDLLIRDMVQEGMTVYAQYAPESWTVSVPKHSWAEYYQQKSRHVSTAISYERSVQWILAMISFSLIGLYVALGCNMLTAFGASCLGMLWLRSLIMWHLSRDMLREHLHRDVWAWIPLLDFILAVFYISLSFTLFIKPKEW